MNENIRQVDEALEILAELVESDSELKTLERALRLNPDDAVLKRKYVAAQARVKGGFGDETDSVLHIAGEVGRLIGQPITQSPDALVGKSVSLEGTYQGHPVRGTMYLRDLREQDGKVYVDFTLSMFVKEGSDTDPNARNAPRASSVSMGSMDGGGSPGPFHWTMSAFRGSGISARGKGLKWHNGRDLLDDLKKLVEKTYGGQS